MTSTISGHWMTAVDLDDEPVRPIDRADRFLWCEAELKRYRYKPTFTLEMIHIATDRWYDAYLAGTFRAPDSRHTPPDAPDDWPTTTLNFTTPVPDYIARERDSDMFAEWLRGVLRNIEAHELDEWLRRDGVILHDPHEGAKAFMKDDPSPPTAEEYDFVKRVMARPLLTPAAAQDLIKDVTLP